MSLIRRQKRQTDPFDLLYDWEHPFLGFSLFPTTEKDSRWDKEIWSPAVDISEDDNNIYVKADLPGLKKEDIQLDMDKDVMTIRGEKRSESENNKKNFHRVERYYGMFERRMGLPANVDENQIKAEYKDGVLSIVLPKKRKTETKKIEIK